MSNRVSIIVPVLNEERNIQQLNNNLKSVKAHEVIIVDGGSTDNTPKLVDSSFTFVVSPKKGRGNQMNYGTQLATGEVFFFVHGDSLLPMDCIKQIEAAIDNGTKVGCFKLKFDSKSPLMRICGFCSKIRVKYRNIAFGDQGIFITKELFNQIGRFPELPLMEDYRLSMNLKSQGYHFKLLKGKIITSERRFLKLGRLKTMWKMQKLQYMFRKNMDINQIAEMYNK